MMKMLSKRLGALNSNAQKETVEREDGGVYADELPIVYVKKSKTVSLPNILPPLRGSYIYEVHTKERKVWGTFKTN